MRPPSLLCVALHARPNALAVRILTRPLRMLSSSNSDSTTTPNASSNDLDLDLDAYISKSKSDIFARSPKVLIDTLSPLNSHLLDLALEDHLPAQASANPDVLTSRFPRKGLSQSSFLPEGHHLVYFPIQAPNSALQPDGTDPDHAPGAPFVRRMWAGGSIRYNPGIRFNPFDSKGWCVESVGEPVLKQGRTPGEEKVFVEVRRQYGVAPTDAVLRPPAANNLIEKYGVRLEETRKLVFMRNRGPAKTEGEGVAAPPPRVIRSPHRPEYSFTLVPDARLLFQFSALTYNAHAIHLDPDYARNQEGYPERLVHGPLTLVLMLSALRGHLRDTRDVSGPGRAPEKPALKSIDYRNIAPLFMGQEVKVCVRETAAASTGAAVGQRTWDLWVEGPGGAVAVRGSATTQNATVGKYGKKGR